MAYISRPVMFLLLFFALKNILVSLAKLNSDELHCPATALIDAEFIIYCMFTQNANVFSSIKESVVSTPRWVSHYTEDLNGKRIKIAVLDAAFDTDHHNLKNNIVSTLCTCTLL